MMATFKPRHFCQDEIRAMLSCDLRSIVRGTKPDGIFMLEVAWARSELVRRQVEV